MNFSSVKAWLMIALITTIGGLLTWTKILTGQRNAAESERDAYKRSVEEIKRQQRRSRDVAKAQKQARKEAQKHAAQQKPTTARPGGEFGDDRVHDDA